MIQVPAGVPADDPHQFDFDLDRGIRAQVYGGKATREMTKSKRTLRQRLNEHVTKISGRENITLDEMQVRYLTFESEWWVFAAEFAIVVHYKPEWNASGFGSKVPGTGRPGTHRVSRWNEMFPPKPL